MGPLDAAFLGQLLGLAALRSWFTWTQRGSRRRRPARGDPERVRWALMMLTGSAAVGGAAAFFLARDATRPFDLALPEPLRWAGAALGAMALALFAWTHHALGANWSARLLVREGAALVTTGPYRWVRHPMYTSVVLLSAALLLTSSNLAAAGGWPVFAAVVLTRIGAEERLMREAFGETYRAYAARTGRLFPRLRPSPAPQG